MRRLGRGRGQGAQGAREDEEKFRHRGRYRKDLKMLLQ